jgi:hypothetical protein
MKWVFMVVILFVLMTELRIKPNSAKGGVPLVISISFADRVIGVFEEM